MLLLHGWTMDGRVWAPQLSLQEEFHLIVPNRRGCGLSSAPPSLEQESDDILRLLNRCAVERVVVMGERGGGVARRSPKN